MSAINARIPVLRIRMAVMLLCGLVFTLSASAQNPQPAQPAPPIGVYGGNAGLVVADMERAMAFYRNVLGLAVITSGAAPWPADPALRAAAVSTVPIPGAQWALELVKLAQPGPPFRPRMQDAGALTLILFVRDLDQILTRARAASVPVITTGGTTGVGPNRGIKATVIQGPDGEFIELLEPPPPAQAANAAAPPPAPTMWTNVLRGNLRITVADADPAARAFEALLGVPFRGGPAPVSDPGVPPMLGQPESTFHLRIAQFPVSAMTFELLDISGPDEVTTRVARSAPGTAYLRVGLAPARTPAAGIQTDRDNLFLMLHTAQP